LYSAIEWPVSRGTSSISPLIKWNYSDNPSVRKSGYEKLSKIEFRHVSIDINEPEHEYFKGHLVDDRLIFPGVGYIFLVWETFAIMNAKKYSHFAVTFENIEFKNATLLREDSPTILDIMINPENGQFEVFNFTKSAVTGCIKHTEDPMLFATETNNSLLASSVISKEDFYKNLRMMGLQHHGAFAPVTEFNIDFSYGKIKWDGRWIAFLDGILQVVIFSVDDKEFKLLKTIQKFVIDPKVHFNTIDNLQSENIELEVFRDSKKIKCGGVEVYDAEKVHVTKKISTDHLVTQTHKFVSHLPAPILSSKQATKFCLDIAIENLQLDSYKLVEIDDGKKPLKKCLNQQSAMVESYYLTSQKLDSDSFKAEMFDGVEVVNKSLSSYSDCHFIIKSNCLNDIEFLDNASQSLFDEGFIISREASGIDQEMAQNLPANYQLVALIPTLENETLVLLQLVNEKFTIPQNVVKITNLENETYDWLEKLKVLIKDGSVVVYSQNEPFSGILGFVNCIRKEPGLNSLQCVFIDDPQAPPFEVNHLFYSEQLKLGLAINVLKTGKWGSYRHFPINEAPELRPNSDFAFADIGTPGDLSSFKWFQGPSDLMRADEEEVVSVQYAALNFRDVMVALGKLPNKSSDNQHIAIGFEYAGIKRNGERVIGILLRDAGFASHVKQHHRLRWKCPDNWSLQEAATIPVVYLTVYHSFFNLVQIEKGNTILIHSGCGGVGLAAIRVAFAYGLEVFTTVSTEEKKQFLLQEFPQLKEENIGNSRNTSFEDMIMQRTNGKGVDYILNSLPDEKFEASIRCLAFAGTFIEIAHNSFTGNYKFESDCKIFYSFDLFYLCSEEHKRALVSHQYAK
jgi:fatty acid synthase